MSVKRKAEHFGIGMELGSQSPLINSPEMEYTDSIAREAAPSAFLVANIGAAGIIDQPGHTAYTVEQIHRFI